MLEQMFKTIDKYNMLSPGDHVIVGVSGGADSVALLCLLLTCGGRYGLTVSALHVNHGIRGPEAERDEIFVSRLCEERGVRLVVRREDVPALAKEDKMTLEEAGRTARYAAFHAALKEHGANKIAVAHHKNDNAETMLMRFCRGAGLAGLAGIPPVRGAVIRPLIETTRKDIENYCLENALDFIQDSTNFSGEHARNRVRFQLIPFIEKHLNPSVVNVLCRSAALFQDDNAYLDGLAAEAFAACECGREAFAGEICLRAAALAALPAPIARRVVRLGLLKLNDSLHNVSSEHIMDIIELSGKKTGKSVRLPHNTLAEMNYGFLFLWKEDGQRRDFCYDLRMDEPVAIPEAGVTVCASREKPAEICENGCTIAFCYDKIERSLQNQPLLIRSARPGDRIYFEQIGGHKKLKDYFAERALPRRARGRVALLACGPDVLWIMGEKPVLSGEYKAAESSGNILYVSVYGTREGHVHE